MDQFKDMVRFLDCTYPMRREIVPCLIGGVGIGKTQAVMEHARNVNAGKVVTIIASQCLPTEVSGMKMPVAESHSMEIYDSLQLASLEDGDILFFDELLEADQLVLSACLTLIESRQMTSGRMLPDVQIVAATNATVMPAALKASIRQRFLFKKYVMDKQSTARYIEKLTGLHIETPVLANLTTDSDKYNILSPRSLTKMAQWMASCDDAGNAETVATMLNQCWDFPLGDSLYESWKRKANSPDYKVKRVIVEEIRKLNTLSDTTSDIKMICGDNIDEFENSTLEELMELVKALPDDWVRQIEERLNEEEVEY